MTPNAGMVYHYSTIQDAYKCLRLYKIKHIDGLQEPRDSADMYFGSAMHKAIECALIVDPVMGPEDPLLVFQNVMAHGRTLPLQYTRLDHSALTKAGEEFIRKFLKLHMKHFEVFQVEQKIRWLLAGEQMEGTPDFVGKYKGIPSVVDFKTSAYAYDKKKIVVDEQMYLYAHALREAQEYEVKQLVYIVFCKGDLRIQTLVLPLSNEKLSYMIANVETMVNDLSQRKEWPMNRRECLKCPFFTHCYGDSNESDK